jgi:hypothetical protein
MNTKLSYKTPKKKFCVKLKSECCFTSLMVRHVYRMATCEKPYTAFSILGPLSTYTRKHPSYYNVLGTTRTFESTRFSLFTTGANMKSWIGFRTRITLSIRHPINGTRAPTKASVRKWFAVATIVISMTVGQRGASTRMKRCGEKRHMQTAKKRDVPKCKLGIAAMVSWKRLLFQTLEPPALLCRTSTKPYSGGSKRGGEQRQRVTMTKAIALSTAIVRRIRWNVEGGR